MHFLVLFKLMILIFYASPYAVDDPAASLHFNRRCGHTGVINKLGCRNETITIQGEGEYPGRVCFCEGDLCNTDV